MDAGASSPTDSGPRPHRGILLGLVACAIGVAGGIFALGLAAGLWGPSATAVAVALVVAALVAWLYWKRPIVPIDEAAGSRGLALVAGAATVVALVLLARLAVFMADPSLPKYSLVPSSAWEVGHSCVSAYFVAAGAADRVPNLYADSLYTSPDDDPAAPRKALTLGRFRIDVYEYPPPFLLVPRVLRLAFPDFTRFRAMWFGVNCAIALLALLILARALGPTAGTRALLLSPLVWASLPTLSTLQKGNVHVLMIAIAVIAMGLFERRRWVAGGALLGYAAVSKLFPGLLLVELAVRRKWRAVLWAAAWCLALASLTVWDIGWSSVASFLRHLPGLVGGEAFPAFRNPMAVAVNFSVPGLVFKLKLFGVAGMGFGAAKLVGWLYTLVVVGIVVAAARRPVAEGRQPFVWLAILILATLRSPFLPQAYAAFPPLVLLVLIGATRAPSPRTIAAILLTWLALNVYWPLDWPMDPRVLAALSAIPQATTLALALVALRMSREAPPARAGAYA